MVALSKIELREPLCAPCFVQQSVNMWQRLDEGLRDCVEAPVIVAYAPRAVGLAGKHNGSRVTGRRGLDPTSIEQVK